MRIARRARSNHHPVRMEARRGNGPAAALAQEAGVRLERREHLRGVHVEDLDGVAAGAGREDGRVLVHRQRAQRVARRADRLERVVRAHVPQLHLPAAAPRCELARAAALDVYIGDPLSVLFPYAYHGGLRAFANVVDADRAVAKAGDEDVAFDLVGAE